MSEKKILLTKSSGGDVITVNFNGVDYKVPKDIPVGQFVNYLQNNYDVSVNYSYLTALVSKDYQDWKITPLSDKTIYGDIKIISDIMCRDNPNVINCQMIDAFEYIDLYPNDDDSTRIFANAYIVDNKYYGDNNYIDKLLNFAKLPQEEQLLAKEYYMLYFYDGDAGYHIYNWPTALGDTIYDPVFPVANNLYNSNPDTSKSYVQELIISAIFACPFLGEDVCKVIKHVKMDFNTVNDFVEKLAVVPSDQLPYVFVTYQVFTGTFEFKDGTKYTKEQLIELLQNQ